ncbi:hypothetical protein HU200_065115 [Digitaria exilis]|uniref:Aminopeptidase n=1 Tax=Digitaria exilis TaxID=1010633 RepID=A0A835DUY9_9POAL|nr:hypothetical protein HU200_065115 [Digitaria exilis]
MLRVASSMASRAAGSGAVLLLLVFVSVLPGASGGGGGRKMGFGGEARGVVNKGANVVEAAAPPPPRRAPAPAPPVAAAGSLNQFRGKAMLPRFAAPRRYDLRLRPDLVACTFTGAAAVTVAVSAPTRFLVLNAADLSVDRASIRFRDLAPKEVVFFADDEILVLGFSNDLPLGEGVLSMKFNGTLNDQMRGFYRSKYQYKGKMKNMAVTQFESVDARRCFPCWDEPAFKAKFKITLEVSSGMVALSNMPIANQTVTGTIKTISYQESPLMSTYLVAIVVGLLEYIEGVTPEGTKVRVYTQVGKSSQGKFALDVGVKSLHLYKDYFGTPYPLPKLDMVAIPDFAAGAMENYGLVTFREVALLFDEESSAESSKQSVPFITQSSLLHKLPTIYLSLVINDELLPHLIYSFFPQWNIWTQFLDDTTAGLKLDSLEESHPIEVEIHHASEVDEIFDAISYDKGASVIRMLQNYLGAERFQKALASYIRKFAYSNAKTEDLWAVLEEKSGEPVKNLMTTWTKQQGYPVINAKLNGNYLELEQKLIFLLLQAQFLLDGSSGSGMWIVPITAGCGSYDMQKKFLLKGKSDRLDIRNITSQCSNQEKGGKFWIKLNINQTGFYRVQYDDKLAAALQNALQFKKLSVMDRIGKALSVSLNVAKVSVDATPGLVGDIKQLLIKLLLPPAMYVKGCTLCYCKDKNIVLESLNLLFTNEVRSQDAYYVLQGLSVETRETAWLWLKANWDRITKKYGNTQEGGFIRYVTTLFSSNEKAAEFSSFFATRKKPEFERTLKQSLENVRISARWIQGIRSEPRLAQTVQELLRMP